MSRVQIICPYCKVEIDDPKRTAVSEFDKLAHVRCVLKMRRGVKVKIENERS